MPAPPCIKDAVVGTTVSIKTKIPFLPDEQNVKAIQTYVRNRAEALEAKSIYKSLILAVKGEARESALKEFHNGSEVVKHEKPDAQSEKSQLQRYFESQM